MSSARDFEDLDRFFAASLSSFKLRISVQSAWPSGVCNSAALALSSALMRGGIAARAVCSADKLMRLSIGICAELFTSSSRSSN